MLWITIFFFVGRSKELYHQLGWKIQEWHHWQCKLYFLSYSPFWNFIIIAFHPIKAELRKIVEDTSELTRIYIFYGRIEELLYFMTIMRETNLFNNHEYVIIYVEKEKQKEKRNFYQYLWDQREIIERESKLFGNQNWDCRQLYNETYPYASWNSLIVIAPSP